MAALHQEVLQEEALPQGTQPVKEIILQVNQPMAVAVAIHQEAPAAQDAQAAAAEKAQAEKTADTKISS